MPEVLDSGEVPFRGEARSVAAGHHSYTIRQVTTLQSKKLYKALEFGVFRARVQSLEDVGEGILAALSGWGWGGA